MQIIDKDINIDFLICRIFTRGYAKLFLKIIVYILLWNLFLHILVLFNYTVPNRLYTSRKILEHLKNLSTNQTLCSHNYWSIRREGAILGVNSQKVYKKGYYHGLRYLTMIAA